MKNQMIYAAAAVPSMRVADVKYNTEQIKQMLHTCSDCGIVVFPELCVTGYTCADLFGSDLLLEQAEQAIAAFEGDVLVRDHVPQPLETSNQDLVYVGRVRRDLTDDNGLALWCCGDQIRKGAASNAVSIMEYLMNH